MTDQKHTILIIEDDHSLQTIYLEKFTQEGFTVRQGFTGQQGLTLAHVQKPDIILLDVMLPDGMNGFDVMEQLKRDAELSKVPVLVLTNLDSEMNIAKSMGAIDYVVKANISVGELVEKVKSYLK